MIWSWWHKFHCCSQMHLAIRKLLGKWEWSSCQMHARGYLLTQLTIFHNAARISRHLAFTYVSIFKEHQVILEMTIFLWHSNGYFGTGTASKETIIADSPTLFSSRQTRLWILKHRPGRNMESPGHGVWRKIWTLRGFFFFNLKKKWRHWYS